MADNGGVGSQIISELGQIGKQIGTEVAKVPGDIAGKALESLGTSSGKKPGSTLPPSSMTEGSQSSTVWSQIDSEKDQQVRKRMARRALEEFSRGGSRRKEPSIWERLQQEQDQKKKEQQAQQQAQGQQLRPVASKRPAGDLYGKKAKQTATENRNVRQD